MAASAKSAGPESSAEKRNAFALRAAASATSTMASDLSVKSSHTSKPRDMRKKHSRKADVRTPLRRKGATSGHCSPST